MSREPPCSRGRQLGVPTALRKFRPGGAFLAPPVAPASGPVVEIKMPMPGEEQFQCRRAAAARISVALPQDARRLRVGPRGQSGLTVAWQQLQSGFVESFTTF